jgi:hypothetical protein
MANTNILTPNKVNIIETKDVHECLPLGSSSSFAAEVTIKKAAP